MTAVKPGNSSASRLGHRLCSRGWLLLVLRSTGTRLCRCCWLKTAAAAADAEPCPLVKKPSGGGLAS